MLADLVSELCNWVQVQLQLWRHPALNLSEKENKQKQSNFEKTFQADTFRKKYIRWNKKKEIQCNIHTVYE